MPRTRGDRPFATLLLAITWSVVRRQPKYRRASDTSCRTCGAQALTVPEAPVRFRVEIGPMRTDIKETTMKLLAYSLVAAGMLLGSISASAQCTSNTIGGTTYHNCSNGSSGTSNTIGGTTYHNFNDGSSGTSNTIGGTTYHNFNNGGSGTSNTIGGTTYHNYNNGNSGTSNTIGGTTYHNFNNGGSGTSNTIGGTTYHNFD